MGAQFQTQNCPVTTILYSPDQSTVERSYSIWRLPWTCERSAGPSLCLSEVHDFSKTLQTRIVYCVGYRNAGYCRQFVGQPNNITPSSDSACVLLSNAVYIRPAINPCC